MKRFRCFAFVLCFFTVLIFTSACSHQLSRKELDKVYDRLDIVDEFYEQNVPSLSENPIASQSEGAFRNVLFGSLRSEAEKTEALELSKQYENAIDYIQTPVFGYNMVPTYWFNSADRLFRGTYYFESEKSIDRIISSITVRLSDIYGQPSDSNFYTYENEVAAWNSKEDLTAMLSQNQVYYYSNYLYGEVDIEFIIEASKSRSDGYDVYIMFTDYTYYED